MGDQTQYGHPREPFSLAKNIRQCSATYLLLALALIIGAFFIHQWDYIFQEWLQPYRIYRAKGTWHGDLMRVIRPLGKGNVIVVLALFAGACGLKRRAIEMLTAFAIVGILVFPTKKIVGRTRPSGANNDSFPSGDTAGFTAAAVPLVAQSGRFLPVAGLLIPAVATLRVLDNNHYLSDVFAGMALGLIAAAIAMALRPDQRWLFPKLKYRHLALLSVCMSMIWYLPALIRGRGTFFDFAMVFGPLLIYGQCLVYLPFRFQWPQDHRPARWNRFAWLKKALVFGSNKISIGNCAPSDGDRCRVAVVILLAAFMALITFLWCQEIPHLKLAPVGIILLFAFGTITIYTLMQKGRERYAVSAMISVIAILILLFLLHILPDAARYHHWQNQSITVTPNPLKV